MSLHCHIISFTIAASVFSNVCLIMTSIIQTYLIVIYIIYIRLKIKPNSVIIIGSYIRSWERPGDLLRVIEMLCLFASGAQRNERKDTKISITSGRSPGLSQQRM
jgi:hypothetical protein